MSLLSTDRLHAVLGYAGDALTVERFADVQPVLLGGLADVVGCDAVTLTHLDLTSQWEVAVLWPPERATAVSLDGYPDLAATHPLRPAVAQRLRSAGGDTSPVRISDVLSGRQWREHPLRRQVMPAVHDQMSLPLRARGSTVHAVALARSGRAFSDGQRELLAHCGRHLAAALRRVDRGGQHALQLAPTVHLVPAAHAPGLRDRPADAPPAGRPPTGSLSPRERQVIALVAAGLTDAQAARSLGIRPATVSKHLERIYRRLDLPNRVAAVRYWSSQPSASGEPVTSD